MNHRTDPIPPHLAPQRGELIMFENNRLLERLSRIRPATVLTVFLPFLAAAFYLSLAAGRTALASAALFLTGAAFWTLFEYFFHRFIFHFEPEGAFQTRLQFVMHGVHHQYPQDKDRLDYRQHSTGVFIAGAFSPAHGRIGMGIFQRLSRRLPNL